ANKMLEQMSDSDVPMHDLVLVFRDDDGLSSDAKDDIESVIVELNKAKESLDIESILDFSEDEDIADSTVSEDETTILVPIEVSTENHSITSLRDEITQIADKIDVAHALTGESLIEEDIITNSEEGLTKTIYITVVLILIIL